MHLLIRSGTIAIAGVAAVQWWQLGDRAHHICRMYWKFGEFLVDTTAFGLGFFLTCSLVGTAAGALLIRLTRGEGGWPHQLARVSTASIGVGAVLWLIVVASPLVEFVVER